MHCHTMRFFSSGGISVAGEATGIVVSGAEFSVLITSVITSCVGAAGFIPNNRLIRSHTPSCVSITGAGESTRGCSGSISAVGSGSTVGVGTAAVGNTSVTAGVGVSSLAGTTSSVTILADGTRFVLGFFLGPGSGTAYVGVINGGVTEGTGGVTEGAGDVTEGAGGVTEGAGGVTDAVPVGFTEGTGGVTDGGVTDGATGVTVALGTTGNPVCGGSIG